MTPRRIGAVLQALLLAAGLTAGFLWLAAVLGGGLVFRYQGF
jgi:hypothetical protein